MPSSDPAKYTKSPSQETQTHAHFLLLALSRAAQSIQRARTAEDFYLAVGREINFLGGEVTLLLLTEDRQSLSIAYTSYSPTLIRKAEKLTGLTLQGYRLPLIKDGIYERTLYGGTAVFVDSIFEAMAEILPKAVHPFIGALISAFNLRQGALVPLRVDDEVLGLLKVNGSFLSVSDLPAMDSFAGHIAAGLYNVRLTQKLQDELSARREAEEALRASQSTFEGIFNSVTETIYIQDENGVFLDVNLGAEKMYGYSRQDFIGHTPEFLSAPGRNDLNKISSYLQQAFNGEPVEFEFWGIKRDGTVFPKDVRLTAGMYFGRKVVIAVARDITERKKSEEALRSSQARFLALLDSVPDILFVMTLDGVYIDYYTSHAVQLFASPAEFIGKNIRDIMPEQVVNDYFSCLERVLQTGESQLFEYSLNLSGRAYAFEAHVGAYKDGNVLCVARDVTERKQAEESIRQAEKRFKALIENAPDGISLVGLDGKIKYASPTARHMFGYEGESYPLEDPMEFVHPEDVGIVLNGMAELVADPSKSPTLQYRYKHRDGSYRWVESTFSNQFTEPGVEAIVINFKDITERKEMEKALYESEKYYRALIENATDGILVVNSEGKISYESPSAAHLLGYGPGKLIGMNSFDLIHPDDLAEIFETFMNGLGNPGQIHRGEYRLKHQDGEWRYFEIVSHYLMDDPVIMGIIINGRDITKRKQAEEALKESERKFHDVIEKSTDGITLSDESGRIIEFNDAFEHLSGYKREDVLGRFLWDLAFDLMPEQPNAAEYSKQMKRDIEGALQSGDSSSFQITKEVAFQRPDGSLIHVQMRLFSIPTERGRRLGCISRDTTKIKEAEENLKAQNQNLHSLYQMTATLNKIVVIEDIYNAALDSLQSTLRVDRVSILLLDVDGVMRFKAWRGLSEEYRKAAEGHSPWKPDVMDPKPVLVPDAYQDSELESLYPVFKKEGIGALGFIPLTHQGRLLGKFMLYFDKAHPFTEDEIQLSQTIAGHVAFAIFRQQAEKALRNSEELYRILYEDNPSMYFTADENGLILSVNKYGVGKLGFLLEELVGRSILDLFHPDDLGIAKGQIEACLQNPRHTVQIEARKIRKDGSMLWVRESACTTHDIHGRLVILIICDDITDVRQTQGALAASEAELRTLFASMQDTVLVIDREGRYISIAPTNPDRFYISPDEVIGKYLSDFFSEDRVAEFLRLITQVLETKKMVKIEYELILGEKSPWFEASISPMGQDVTIWVARDITERKKIESALIRSELAHRTLFENMPIGLYRTSADGQLLDINPAYLKMFGFSDARSITEKKVWEYYLDPSTNDQFVELISASGSLAAFEAEYIRDDGTTFWAEDYVHLVYNKDGEPEYYEGSLIDVTDRKQAELNLKKSEQLYRLLAERIADVVWVLDMTTMKFKYVSPSVENLLGYTAEEIMDMSMEDFVIAESLAEIQAASPDRVRNFLNGDLAAIRQIDQMQQRHKNGSIVTVEVSSTFVLNAMSELEAIGVSRDITRRKQVEEELRLTNKSLELAHKELRQMFEYEQVLARTDGLTKLNNRRYFFELAQREFSASIRYERPLTIILFDIDGFKPANDTFGHAMGDIILTQISHVAASQVRDVDILARYGGDEFIILLPQTSAEHALTIAERVRTSVASAHILMDGISIGVTLSLGVAELSRDPRDISIEDVIRRADKALYQAKQSGRNHTVIYTED
ncbi:MAG: PAS domain S-box protein [Anaerolineales bacterium]|nr:PAS domain S-box protein [Anaerolineales bacterium]